MSPECGVESSGYLTQTSHSDYHRLRRIDALGLMDGLDGEQEVVYEEFKEQLQRDSAKLGGMKLAYSGKLETHPYKIRRK